MNIKIFWWYIYTVQVGTLVSQFKLQCVAINIRYLQPGGTERTEHKALMVVNMYNKKFIKQVTSNLVGRIANYSQTYKVH